MKRETYPTWLQTEPIPGTCSLVRQRSSGDTLSLEVGGNLVWSVLNGTTGMRAAGEDLPRREGSGLCGCSTAGLEGGRSTQKRARECSSGCREDKEAGFPLQPLEGPCSLRDLDLRVEDSNVNFKIYAHLDFSVEENKFELFYTTQWWFITALICYTGN